jgi:hypothetical protein
VKYMALKDGHDFGKQRGRDSTVIWKVAFKYIKSTQAPVAPPVIPATQEAEIRRIVVRDQPGKIVLQTLCQKKPITKKGWLKW